MITDTYTDADADSDSSYGLVLSTL